MNIEPDLIIRGGSVCTPSGLRNCDVIVADGRVVGLSKDGASSTTAQVIDAGGLTVLPGAIDAHVHFDDPGRASWEGWPSGSLAAAAGGVTTVIDMPIDSDPPTTTAERLIEKRTVAGRSSFVDFALWGGLIDADTERLTLLAEAGAVGFKAFLCDSGWSEFPPVDEATLERACHIARELGVVVGVHCESEAMMSSTGSLNVRRPEESEIDAVTRVTAIAQLTGARVHIVHTSSALAVAIAQVASNVTVETCPHYLALSAADVLVIGSTAQCAPPVRDESNRLALWDALARGEIDTIASDHSPTLPALKETDPPFLGVDGVETTLSVMLSEGRCGIERLSELRTEAARIFSLEGKGAIAIGYDADLALVDLGATWTVGRESLHSRHRSSPFLGRTLSGQVTHTIIRGELVYTREGWEVEPHGRFIAPTTARRVGRPSSSSNPSSSLKGPHDV